MMTGLAAVVAAAINTTYVLEPAEPVSSFFENASPTISQCIDGKKTLVLESRGDYTLPPIIVEGGYTRVHPKQHAVEVEMPCDTKVSIHYERSIE